MRSLVEKIQSEDHLAGAIADAVIILGSIDIVRGEVGC
jgi:NADH:ubiquinone oxidoreductase subunit D